MSTLAWVGAGIAYWLVRLAWRHRYALTTWLMRQRHLRISPFYHEHRMGEPYGVPMEEDHIRCLVCDREYPVSWRPRFSSTEPKP